MLLLLEKMGQNILTETLMINGTLKKNIVF